MKAHEAKEVARADSLLDQIKRLQSDALRILGKAEEDADWKASVSAIREARGCLETLAKLTQQIRENPEGRLTIEVVIVDVGSKHPEKNITPAAAHGPGTSVE